MSQLPSMPSIELPGTYSAGRFDLDCGTPYSRSPWSDVTGDDWTLEIQCMPGRIFYFHGEELRAPDFTTAEEKLAFALRHVCHLFVDRIDSSGLQDVCQSLAEFYEYYRPREASTRLLPETRTQDAKMSSRSIAPAFVIDEE